MIYYIFTTAILLVFAIICLSGKKTTTGTTLGILNAFFAGINFTLVLIESGLIKI